ncbi:hypothetical protein GCM10010420_19890 [Streptomyces glaucosporus]|uniref:Secreted protein n=1 Tax=Streptomyces glaucosporus TaxID=284044 RepID=A0ABN3I5Q5_9ACTN
MQHTTGDRLPSTSTGARAGSRPDGPPGGSAESRGCLFALSQPPLMIFLAVVATLVLLAAVHDLFLL